MNHLFSVIDNLRVVVPPFLFFWALFLICTVRKPQKYSNSIILMIALFFTLMLVAGLFGESLGWALLCEFLLIMAALFCVPAILIVNGIIMIKREGRSFAHLLSLLLGVVVAVGELACAAAVMGMAQYDVFKNIDKYAFFLGMTVFYGCCLLLNFVLYSVFIQIIPHKYDYDYVIIHGCRLAEGYRVTKLLSSRIDKAIHIYEKCKVKPVLIPSGGKGSDEQIPEAQAIAEYLVDHGIPRDHIIKEDRSKNTMENLVLSKRIIDGREGRKKTALVSNNYHIYRCLIYAKRLKMDCWGVGGGVASYFYPTAIIREFVAVFRQPKFIICSLIGYAVFMTVMSVMFLYM